MARYEIDDRFIEKNKNAIAAGGELTFNIKDIATQEWKYVKGVSSMVKVEGAEETDVVDMVGNAIKAKCFVRVLEDLSEEGELDGFYALGEAP
ncbi:MAG: hypothetical protein Q7J12_09385 [Syntrophales bacterium]|nr:hypothetical protein [Syntrophales bacterium]